MKQRTLGAGGPSVSAIGLGAYPMGGALGPVDKSEALALVRAAIDNGITLVDTAQNYGTSEELVGEALRDGYRDRCFLATKVSYDFSPKGIASAMDDSLRKLRVDYVDLYQIHSWRPDYPIEGSMEAMGRLRDQGKTRFVGVSNFSAEQMARAGAVGTVQSNQCRLSMFGREREAEDLPYCERQGIGFLAHSPLAKGLLTGRYSAGHRFPESDGRFGRPDFQGELFAAYLEVAGRLGEVAADRGISMVQLVIAWASSRPGVTCVLVGAKIPAQVRDHASAVEVTLTSEDLERIDAILQDSPSR